MVVKPREALLVVIALAVMIFLPRFLVGLAFLAFGAFGVFFFLSSIMSPYRNHQGQLVIPESIPCIQVAPDKVYP